MAKKSFMPRSRADRQILHNNYVAKLAIYATKYGKTPAEITALKADNTAITYWNEVLSQLENKLTDVRLYVNQLADGALPSDAAATVPVMLVLPTPIPAAVQPGVYPRLSASALSLKAQAVYAMADGSDLGIEGEETAGKDFLTLKPEISVRVGKTGFPELVWKRLGMDGIDIYMQTKLGDVWTFLGTDTVPNFTDNTPLPTGSTSEVRYYKARYRENENQVGLWSAIVNLTVSEG